MRCLQPGLAVTLITRRHWRRGRGRDRGQVTPGGGEGGDHVPDVTGHLVTRPCSTVSLWSLYRAGCLQGCVQSRPLSLSHWLRVPSLRWASLTATGSHHSPLTASLGSSTQQCQPLPVLRLHWPAPAARPGFPWW